MKVLIAIDGSPAALAGVRFAARLVGASAGCAITLLYVRPSHTPTVLGLGTAGLLGGSRLDEEVDAVEQEILAEACAALAEAGLRAETQVESGSPSQAIIRVATDGGYELVVIGSRGHGELKSMLVGSTSQAVVHGAPCPVLVVR